MGCLGQVLWAEWRLLGEDWLGVVVGWVLPIDGLALVVVFVCVCARASVLNAWVGVDYYVLIN